MTEKPKGYPYIPNKVIRVEGWTVKLFNLEQTVTCHHRSRNVTYVITPTTDKIVHIPREVIKELVRCGFLARWQDEKVRQSVMRLKVVATKFQEISKKSEDRKYENQPE